MLLILLNWVLITFTALCIGSGITNYILHFLKEKEAAIPIIYIFFIGISSITCIANICSLFFPIDYKIELGLILLSILLLIKGIKPFSGYKFRSYHAVTVLVATLFSVIISLNITANIDESGYYLPLVKWIEYYAVTPGTALLNHRIGFNSSLHMLSAIFSQTAIYEGGLYDINGLLFICFNTYFICAIIRLIRGQHDNLWSDWILSCALIFPFSFIVDSIDVDYLSIMGGIFIHAEVIKYLRTNINIGRLVVLSLISIFLLTVRPFSLFLCGGIILLWLRLYYFWMKAQEEGLRQDSLGYSKRALGKGMVLCMAGTICILMPWLIRNYFISGYLIFPVYYVDLFNPDWKVPLEVIKPSYEIIGEFAKVQIIREDYLYNGLQHLDIVSWAPLWLDITFTTLIGKTIILGLPIGISILFYKIIRSLKKINRLNIELIYLFYLLGVITLWFISFPSIRFAWAWILAFMASVGFLTIERKADFLKGGIYTLTFLVVISAIRLGYNINWSQAPSSTLFPPKIKTAIPHTTKTQNGLTLKYALDPHCFGMKPPCLPYNNPLDIELRGRTLKDGFRIKRSEE